MDECIVRAPFACLVDNSNLTIILCYWNKSVFVPQACEVSIDYVQIPTDLRRYILTIYLFEVVVPDGAQVEDYLFPEWATVHIVHPRKVFARTRSGECSDEGEIPITGPRSSEVFFRTGSAREWGIVLHPLGWATFVGESADLYANALTDAAVDPVFARFVPVAQSVFGDQVDRHEELARLLAGLRAMPRLPVANETAITDTYAALLDAEIKTVRALAQRAGISERQLERVCRRAFGHTPKVLLRRQRFLRSLTQFTLDPSLKWIGAMDAGYHDQAQFVRDFREFMGMLPREYAELDKPILGPVMIERTRFARDTADRLRAENKSHDRQSGS